MQQLVTKALCAPDTSPSKMMHLIVYGKVTALSGAIHPIPISHRGLLRLPNSTNSNFKR